MRSYAAALCLVALTANICSAGEPTDLGKMTIEVPAGFTVHNTIDDKTSRITIMVGPMREDATQVSLFVNEIDVSAFSDERIAAIPSSPFQDIDAYLGSIRNTYPDFSRETLERFEIDGKAFARITWSGTMRHPALGNVELRGAVYIHRDGDKIYQLTFMDHADHAHQSIHDAHETFMTMKFN